MIVNVSVSDRLSRCVGVWIENWSKREREREQNGVLVIDRESL